MRGDLSNFAKEVNRTIEGTLKEYISEVELAIGPAKVNSKSVQNIDKNKEKDSEER